jgi:hypothetical protein
VEDANTTYALINGVLVAHRPADGPVLTAATTWTRNADRAASSSLHDARRARSNALDPGPRRSAHVSRPHRHAADAGRASQVGDRRMLINSVNATAATFTGGTTLMSATNVAYVNSALARSHPTNAF